MPKQECRLSHGRNLALYRTATNLHILVTERDGSVLIDESVQSLALEPWLEAVNQEVKEFVGDMKMVAALAAPQRTF